MNIQRSILAAAILFFLMSGVLIMSLAAPVFVPDDQPIGYVGQPAMSNFNVSSGKEMAYSIDYQSSDWSGNLHKYKVTKTGAISVTDEWSGGAAAIISAQDFDTGRKIITIDGTTKIPFRWEKFSGALRTSLDTETASKPTETISPLLNFIRGDISNESSTTSGFRKRTSVLGDIIHSTPIYCSAAICGASTVFVGANDGMLHAIDAVNGKERFAYIPSILIPKLNKLKAKPYVHTYFVDGRMDLKKIDGRAILVGSLGAGGKGLFALDVSNAAPASELDAATNILWEITPSSSGFANLGYTYAHPTLAKLKNGMRALIVGNGYNNAGNGHAVLYLINPLNGEKIKEIDTHDHGGTGSLTHPNGLSSPSLWASNYDGKIDTAYAGDIDGTLWKFDLLSGTAIKLHTTHPAQAITSMPGLLKHPFGGAMVIFVTGRMLSRTDLTDKGRHYAYGIWDGSPSTSRDLLEQTLTEATYTEVSPNVRVRWASANLPDWRNGHHKGWKTMLPTGGERLVGDGAFVTDGVFQFISTNPTVNTGAASSDTKTFGENWWMQINALTGGDVGIILFDLNRDQSLTSDDQIWIGQSLYSPVGRHMGGGTSSQMLPIIANGSTVFHANRDTNPPLTAIMTSSEASKEDQPKGRIGRQGITPGGTVIRGKPTHEGEIKEPARGEITESARLGRINWREFQP